MDAGFTGSGMVLTAVPVFEPKLSLPSKIVSLGELLPGLVLFTGCYGSDRAYTMYSLLLAILRESPKKVSIVEQVPRYNIDFVKDSLVMRRIAFDPKTTYFSELLRALTTDVDIICLDDISDPKAFEAALKACASGKTVFGMSIFDEDSVKPIMKAFVYMLGKQPEEKGFTSRPDMDAYYPETQEEYERR